MKTQGLTIDKGILRKKSKARGLTPSSIKIHCKTVVIKTVCNQYKDKQRGQWNRIQSPEIA